MRIAVIGSINTDLSIQVPHFPQRNETVVGHGDYVISQGGKGANQAAAAAAAGAAVYMIGCIGRDDFGGRAIEDLQSMGVDCGAVRRDPDHATGLAAIYIDPAGDNCITVAPGANAALSPADVRAARDLIAACEIVMLQLEVPYETIDEAVRVASEVGTTVMLDPAPAPGRRLSCLAQVDVLTPNEVEAAEMTGISPDSPQACTAVAERLLAEGPRHVILTLGARGCFVASPGQQALVPARVVQAIDTTGAGDVFSGYLACALARSLEMTEAVSIAVAASALSVTRAGARASLPHWDEVLAFRSSEDGRRG
ncbi:MAG: ribokinase [Gammaproteobacteria bacterium]|nr:ribokinase [Gammaproteobacteria bacterium]